MAGKDSKGGLREGKEALRTRAGPEGRSRGPYGKLERSITPAWALAEWEVVMDQRRFPLSRKRPPRGQA